MDMASLNADTRRGGQLPHQGGLAPSLTPESASTGESVRYAPDPEKQWFVLRATYGREQKAYDALTLLGLEAYLPMRRTLFEHGLRKSYRQQPLIPQLVFVYGNGSDVRRIVKDASSLPYLSFYYDHFTSGASGYNPPLTVPYDEMLNFIRLTSIDNPKVELVSARQCHFKRGDRVVVTAGAFRGVEGRVARVKGQQCVVVELKGICLVSTAYVPTPLLESVGAPQ